MKIPLTYIEENLVLEIIGEGGNSVQVLTDTDALEYGESIYQVTEGCSYEYRFNSPDYRFTDTLKGIVTPSNFDVFRGRLTPNVYVGTLTLEIENKKSTNKWKFDIEVRSVKASYRDEYRYMLKDITDKCTELIMQIDSPINQFFETDFYNDSKTLYQRFSFVKSEIESKEFEEAVQKITTNPSTSWKNEREDKDIRNIKRFTQQNIREIVSKNNRMPLFQNNVLFKTYNLNSIPTKIESSKKVESIDNSENRFIKHALKVFLNFCENCNEKFEDKSRAKFEAALLSDKLSALLHQPFFKEISQPTFLKLNSPVLQRKHGYREVLNTWLKFDLAAKLIWTGGENVYKSGKKDVAILYEYWLFFSLLDILKNEKVFDIEPKEIHELIQFNKHNISLNLKQGKTIALQGVFYSSSRKLNIVFSYNKTFGGGKIYPAAGSYTTTLRPDYTLSIWPAEIHDIYEAEKKEMVTHIHFDSKYKINNFFDLVRFTKDDLLTEKENDDLLKDEEDERKGNFKNADLLKMHAYKDAIRRTSGAYILYPGNGKNDPFRGFHELIPGLGAFVMKPDENNTGKEELKNFILKVVDNFLDRASQRENVASKIYEIHKEPKHDDDILLEFVPEYLGNEKLIPDDTHVIIGFYKDEQHLEWIQSKRLYNIRYGEGYPLSSKIIGADYLLLYTSDINKIPLFFKLASDGPKIYSAEELKINSGYPTQPTQPMYLVYTLEQYIESEFKDVDWNLKRLHLSSTANRPHAISLSKLLKNRE